MRPPSPSLLALAALAALPCGTSSCSCSEDPPAPAQQPDAGAGRAADPLDELARLWRECTPRDVEVDEEKRIELAALLHLILPETVLDYSDYEWRDVEFMPFHYFQAMLTYAGGAQDGRRAVQVHLQYDLGLDPEARAAWGQEMFGRYRALPGRSNYFVRVNNVDVRLTAMAPEWAVVERLKSFLRRFPLELIERL